MVTTSRNCRAYGDTKVVPSVVINSFSSTSCPSCGYRVVGLPRRGSSASAFCYIGRTVGHNTSTVRVCYTLNKEVSRSLSGVVTLGCYLSDNMSTIVGSQRGRVSVRSGTFCVPGSRGRGCCSIFTFNTPIANLIRGNTRCRLYNIALSPCSGFDVDGRITTSGTFISFGDKVVVLILDGS